jgi:hypothetical protein
VDVPTLGKQDSDYRMKCDCTYICYMLLYVQRNAMDPHTIVDPRGVNKSRRLTCLNGSQTDFKRINARSVRGI